MEVGRRGRDAAESAVSHGRLFARPAGTFNLKIAQRPVGLIIRKKTFCFVFCLLKNEGPPQGMPRLLSSIFRVIAHHSPSELLTAKLNNSDSPTDASPLLLYPRLISFEIDRVGGSTRQGCRRERCQPWTAVCAAHWSDQSQNAEGTRRADYPQQDFCPLLVFLKVGPPEGHVLFARPAGTINLKIAQRPAESTLLKNEGLPQGMTQ